MSQPVETFKERFRFRCQGLSEDALRVVRFSGHEGLNTLYSFDITLVSKQPIDTEALLFSPARFEIDRAGERTALFTGVPSSVSQGTQFNGWTFYTLSLQPRCHQLTRLVFNRIYLNKNVQQIVEDALRKDSCVNIDFNFSLKGTYPPQEFTMQWNENVYTYVACKLERDGIYYYFDQQADHEKLIFTDSCFGHPRLPNTPPLHYSPDTGLEGLHYEEVITSFTMRRTPLPKNVILRDYDWMRPNTPVEAVGEVAEKGIGSLYFYGDGFTTEAEGQRLANIRAEGLRCRGKQFFGESSVPALRPGYIFALDKHYDPAFNREYLITEITHEGSQEGYLSLVLGVTLEHPSDKLYYRNNFVCIPSDMQFRPERLSSRNRIGGVINAFVDTSDKTGKAQMDAHGRYKLVFPQDVSGNKDGKASCWVRRAQPYVGPGHGSAFPLSRGVEVLVAFMDGDPDRPFITGAVGNAETGSVDNSGTGEFSGIYTGGGSGLVFNDKDKSQGVTLKAGRTGMFMASGSMDSIVQNSDHSIGITSAMSSEFSGLSKKMSSGFSAKLSSGIKDWTWEKRYPLILQLVRGATALGKASDLNTNHAKGWEAAVAAVKALELIETARDLADTKADKANAYVASISAASGKTSLNLQSQITPKGVAEYAVWATLNFLASGAGEIAKGVKEAAKAEIETNNAVEAHKAAVVLKQGNSENKQKQESAKKAQDAALADALAEKKATAISKDSTLLPSEIEKIELSKEEKNKALAALFVLTDLPQKDQEEWAALEKKVAKKREYTKGASIATATFSTASSLVAEALAFILIAKQRNFKYHLSKEFGGVVINASEANVLITGSKEVRVGSDAGIVLQALPYKHTTKLTKDEPATLWGAVNNTSTHAITTEAVATVVHTAGDALAVANNHKIVATSNLTLTNKFSEAGAPYAKLFIPQADALANHASAVTAAIAAGTPPPASPKPCAHYEHSFATYNAQKAIAANPSTNYSSTIAMEGDALEIRNVGHELKIIQNTPDQLGMTLLIKQDGQIKNSLTFTQSQAVLEHSNPDKACKLELTLDSATLLATSSKGTGSLKLASKSSTLSIAADKSIKIEDETLTLQHGANVSIVFDGKAGSLDMKANKIALTATADFVLGTNGANAKFDAATCKFTAAAIQLG